MFNDSPDLHSHCIIKICILLSAEWINYEQQGIAPDIEVVPDLTLLGAGRDNMLESALAELN